MKQQNGYWHSIQLSRVALLGIMPPPFGGVSVHIYRVMDCLSLQNNTLFFWSTEQRQRKFFPFYVMRLVWHLIRFRPKHVYYHSTYLASSAIELLCLIMLRLLLGYQLYIVDHDCRHLYRRGWITKRLYRWVAWRINTIICIGELTKQSYFENNIQSPHIVVSDAFIPPITRNAGLIKQTYPSSLMDFIKEHTPLLLLSAAHLMRIDGKDMYGIDNALDLLAAIKDEYPDAGLIIGLPHIGDEYYFSWLLQRMVQLKIAEQVYVVHGNKELWPLFQYTDLFIRPTHTDGDSISVREACYFGVPVVATNVCSRPAGVHCFKTGDIADATLITKKVLREHVYETYRKRDYLYP